MLLVPNNFEDDLSLLWGQVLLEDGLVNEVGDVMDHLLDCLVVSAWYRQCALRATLALADQQVALHVDRCMLQLIESLLLELFPDLLSCLLNVVGEIVLLLLEHHLLLLRSRSQVAREVILLLHWRWRPFGPSLILVCLLDVFGPVGGCFLRSCQMELLLAQLLV